MTMDTSKVEYFCYFGKQRTQLEKKHLNICFKELNFVKLLRLHTMMLEIHFFFSHQEHKTLGNF